uniref:Uncharacterized protein n=1 Tax=Caulobacter sp. (strain K31) TaxID=366602 RepID=B0SXT0_CAUSK
MSQANSSNAPKGAVAVLTGDIVRSQRLGSGGMALVHATFHEAVASLNRRWPGLVMGEAQFFRGDAWQLALSRPEMFLRVALFIRARLLSVGASMDTRIAVGLGGVEIFDDEAVSRSVGEAFTLSGHSLDEMGSRVDMWVNVPEAVRGSFFWLPPLLSLCSTLVGRWKPKQAYNVSLALLATNKKQEALAKDARVKRQTLGISLTSAGWPALEDVLTMIEDLDFDGLLRGPAA